MLRSFVEPRATVAWVSHIRAREAKKCNMTTQFFLQYPISAMAIVPCRQDAKIESKSLTLFVTHKWLSGQYKYF